MRGVERPLRHRRDGAESRPDDQVAGGEERRDRKSVRPVGDPKDRRRRARDHHRDHHDRPHRKNDGCVAAAPRWRRHQHHFAAAHIHLRHSGAREKIDPRGRDDAREGGEDRLHRSYSSRRRTQNCVKSWPASSRPLAVEIDVVIGAVEHVDAARIGRIGVKDLPFASLANTLIPTCSSTPTRCGLIVVVRSAVFAPHRV